MLSEIIICVFTCCQVLLQIYHLNESATSVDLIKLHGFYSSVCYTMGSLFIAMTSLNTITKVLCKIFLKLVHLLAILPDRDDKPNFLFYFKLFVTLSFQTGIVYVAHQYRTEQINVITKFVRLTYWEAISEVLGYVNYLAIAWTYLKITSWQSFYKKFGGFDKPNVLENNRYCLVIFCVIIILHASIPGVFYVMLKMGINDISSISSVIVVSCPIFQFYYSNCHAGVILLLIQKICSDLNIATSHINGKTVNVYMARKLFFKAIALTQFFNAMFGYSLLIMFARWIYHIIMLCLHFIEILKADIYVEESRWFMIFGIGLHTILCSVSSNKTNFIGQFHKVFLADCTMLNCLYLRHDKDRKSEFYSILLSITTRTELSLTHVSATEVYGFLCNQLRI